MQGVNMHRHHDNKQAAASLEFVVVAYGYIEEWSLLNRTVK
jgi:hypothetical protein